MRRRRARESKSPSISPPLSLPREERTRRRGGPPVFWGRRFFRWSREAKKIGISSDGGWMPMDKGHENFARRRDQHELDDDAAAGDDRGLGPPTL